MKKNYSSPETASLEVMAHDIICASGAGAPARGQLNNADQSDFAW